MALREKLKFCLPRQNDVELRLPSKEAIPPFARVRGGLQLTFNEGAFIVGVGSVWAGRRRVEGFSDPPYMSSYWQNGGNVNVTTHLCGGNVVLRYNLTRFLLLLFQHLEPTKRKDNCCCCCCYYWLTRAAFAAHHTHMSRLRDVRRQTDTTVKNPFTQMAPRACLYAISTRLSPFFFFLKRQLKTSSQKI